MDKKRQQWELIKNTDSDLAVALSLLGSAFGKLAGCDIKLVNGVRLQIGLVSDCFSLDYKKRIAVNNIDRLIDELIENAGGFINKQGYEATKHGITLGVLSAYRNDDLELNDLRLLSKSEAADVYAAEFYFKAGIDNLPNLIQPVMLDMVVAIGFIDGIKVLQSVLSKLGIDLVVDGVIGPKTSQSAMVACNVYRYEVLRSICLARIDFYRNAVDADISQSVNLKAWIDRANSFLIA